MTRSVGLQGERHTRQDGRGELGPDFAGNSATSAMPGATELPVSLEPLYKDPKSRIF